MFVTGKYVLDRANKGNYAVGAFNINNMEILQSIIAAAEEKQAPVILQTSEGAIKYAGIEYIAAMVKVAAEKASVPVVLHLDHGTTYDTIMKCIKYGWTSVMIDGSHLPLDENIAATKDIIKVAHACGVSVEAELGRLGGIEDNINVDEKDARFTSPDEAVKFVAETGVDSLAIAIGTAHGKYKGVPKLDFERLQTIKALIPDTPIVLHGASGIPEEDIIKSTKLGVNKINIDTDIRLAFTDAIREFVATSDAFDPRKVMAPAKEAMKKVVMGKIEMFGSTGKAND
ncbi:MAG: class II fructose-1,6-bisphosphate aldolase [Clostridia bacterium]|nr:class II fructose-1,6-bisphosphate aldolase [Clostridia bacterium]